MARRPELAAPLALAVAAALTACLAEEPSPEVAAQIRRGRETYLNDACASCHGVKRQGTKRAPDLSRLSRHWSEKELVRYLRNPFAFPKDSRLQRLADRYPEQMAGLPAASEEKLRELVAFLLSR